MAVRRRAALLVVFALFAGVAAVGPGPAPVGAGAAPGISGTVTGSEGDPLAGAMVAVLRTSDYTPVATAVADGSGGYEAGGVPAGSYLVYVVDPTGDHHAGFHGTPNAATITVTTGWTDVDPVLAAATGGIAGVVTSDADDAPLDGAWVLALGGQDGRVLEGTTADEDGRFALQGLRPGAVLLVFVDPAGAHSPEYFDDTTISDADRVDVVAGEVIEADASLVPAPTPLGEATLTGTITDATSGAPVEGWVAILDATTFAIEGGAQADEDGEWSLSVDAGGHRVTVIDPGGGHASEWYPDLPYDALGTSTVVQVASGGTAVVDEDLVPTTGSLAGIVVEDGSGDPVPGAWAVAIGLDGPRAAVADSAGEYRIDGLPAGEARATFLGSDGLQLQEYWDGGSGFADADPFTIPAGGVHELDVSLAVRPCATSVPAPPTRCAVAAPTIPGAGWTTYTIQPGAHGSTPSGSSLSFSGVAARRYQFVFDGSARYVLTNPTQPEDQLDWNKLPGRSDCGDLDLAENGWMFAWRWRTDLTPRVLEINAYANNDGTHLWLPEPLLTLTSAQLDARLPVWFDMRISSDRTRYEFVVRGPGSRLATGSLPRACTTAASASWQWTAGFYFGGTSTAPSTITGLMRELPT